MTMPTLEQYTVGWICAVKTEFVAAQAFLDEEHDEPEGVTQKDDNNYALGRMGKHNVVIAILPKGEYGTTSAATVARNMVHSFPNIRIGLMVGIAGGAPSKKHDIRLGDIVVSSRNSGQGGVFQYDYGKTLQSGVFEETGRLNQPPQVLLTAVHGLEAHYERHGNQLDSKVAITLDRWPRLQKHYSRPQPTSDRLYLPSSTHPENSESDCLEACSKNPAHMVIRQARGEDDDNITIHAGLIASGNQVMKDANVRDMLIAERDVLCFEMEAAGLMNHFPCLVVRGICDYSDSHKNKAWQGFAAMVAAAYAKDLLGRISSTKIEMETRFADTLESIQENQSQSYRVLGETNTVVKEIRSDQHMAAVKEWLAPPDSSTNANSAKELRHEGTGEWFLKSTAFIEWECGSRRHLWLYGMPGCGKTILSTTIYDHISETFEKLSLRFFFDFSDTRKQTVESMLRELVFQLYKVQAESAYEVDDLFKHHNNGRDQPSKNSMSDCLQRMLRGLPKTCIVIDALDECSERQNLLTWMASFVAVLDLSHVKLIMTARDEAEFKQQIPPLVLEDNCVSLQTNLLNADIQSYVESQIEKRPRFKKWATSAPWVLQLVSEKVGNEADGMFRWAACQLESLESCIDLQEVEQALASLPKGLNETYERILRKLPESRRSRSIRILQFLLFSSTPFTLQEAVDILAVRSEGFQVKDRMPDPEHDILQFCPGLIRVIDTAHRSTRGEAAWHGPSHTIPTISTKEVQLAHYSVKEYLLSVQNSFDDSFQKYKASISILRVCFTYFWSVKECLLKCARESVEFEGDHAPFRSYMTHYNEDIVEEFPLLEFVVLEWMDLVLLVEESEKIDEEAADIIEQAADILQDSAGYALWRDWRKPHREFGYDIIPRFGTHYPPHGLLSACRKKLQKTARVLIRRDVDVNTQVSCTAALEGATCAGLHDVVRCLLDIISKFNPPASTYDKLLRIGSELGLYEVVDLILHHQAAPYIRAIRFHAPAIVAAAWFGNQEIIKLLLDNGADINTICHFNDARYANALSAASENENKEVVGFLLDHGADANATPGALTEACRRGCEEVVQLLLDHGADVKANHTALAEACAQGNAVVFQLLLDHGADTEPPRRQDEDTALLTALRYGHTHLAKQLVEYGADIHAINVGYLPPNLPWSTPLQLASSHGCVDVVQLLLERGADVNVQSYARGNTLTAAICADRNREEVTKLLLKHGADVNAYFPPMKDGYFIEESDDEYDGEIGSACGDYDSMYGEDFRHKYDVCCPLSAAVLADSQGLVELLLEYGSDVNDPNRTGEPLRLACTRGDEKVAQLLLEKGADPNAQPDVPQCLTPLFTTLESHNVEVAKLLVDAGANLDPPSGRYPIVLYMAYRTNKLDLAMYLLQKGADLDTPWSIEALRQRYDTILDFLEWAAQSGVPVIPKLPDILSTLGHCWGRESSSYEN